MTIFLCSTLHPHGLFMYIRAFLVAQWVKNLSTMHEMWETWVQSLGWENPLSRKRHPLQYSCLENSVGRGAWWATVYGVTESYTTKHECSVCKYWITFVHLKPILYVNSSSIKRRYVKTKVQTIHTCWDKITYLYIKVQIMFSVLFK